MLTTKFLGKDTFSIISFITILRKYLFLILGEILSIGATKQEILEKFLVFI